MHHPALPTSDLLGFLVLGLLGGFGHCVGMCSPFALFVSRRYGPSTLPRPSGTSGGVVREPPPALLGCQLWYAAGRLATYAALGALAGALGSAVEMAGRLVGIRRGAMVVAGAVLVVWALVALSELVPFRAGGRLFASAIVPPASLFRRRLPGHPFAFGLLLGLLPCGFLYSALVGAVSRGSAMQGAAAMALFGIGTAPALLGVALADQLIAGRRVILNRLAQAFILVMGTVFLWRGLSG